MPQSLSSRPIHTPQAQSDDSRESERDLVARLHAELDRLGQRCVWRQEVWMLCHTHAARKGMERLRIDVVADLDGRLIGIEAKAPPQQAVEIGRALLQCAQYAAGIIAPANRDGLPRAWIEQPLTAVFLLQNQVRQDDFMARHRDAAHRLFGPANVGFLVRERYGLCLRLSAERFWTERRGYHQGMLTKLSRGGSGTFQAS